MIWRSVEREIGRVFAAERSGRKPQLQRRIHAHLLQTWRELQPGYWDLGPEREHAEVIWPSRNL